MRRSTSDASATGAPLATPLLREGSAYRCDYRFVAGGRSPVHRGRCGCSRRLPTKRWSRWRTCGCSTNKEALETADRASGHILRGDCQVADRSPARVWRLSPIHASVCGVPDSAASSTSRGVRVSAWWRGAGQLRRATVVGDTVPVRRTTRLHGRSATGAILRVEDIHGGGVVSSRQPILPSEAEMPSPPDIACDAAAARGARRLVSSSSVGGLRFTPSRPNRSHSSRRSPTRRSSAVEDVRLFTGTAGEEPGAQRTPSPGDRGARAADGDEQRSCG